MRQEMTWQKYYPHTWQAWCHWQRLVFHSKHIYLGGHVAALPEHITVRGNAITCDAGNDIGHGVCVLCCSYLPEHGTCPCNLHQHDHALSLCVCTIDPPARRARVCRICAHHFLTAQTIEIHNNGRYWTCTTQSGLVTFKCTTAYLPRTFEQMLWYATSI